MINKRFSRSSHIAIFCILVTLFTGCGADETPRPTAALQPPEVTLILNPNISDVTTGQTVVLSIEASGQELNFKWSVTRGTLSAPDAPSVIYTPPDTSGVDTVSVEVNSATGTIIRSVSFNVIVPATDTPMPTIIPTNTPLPLPLVEIFPQAVDGAEFSFMSKDMSKAASLTSNFVTDQSCIHSGIYGLRLTYNMPEQQDSGGWGVHWNNPPVTHFDAPSFNFKSLTFWVKGTLGNETFQISMKDTNANEYWVESKLLLVVPSTWTMVSVPLNKFQGVNVSSVENFAFGFNSTHSTGTICIDDIAFAP